jgi:hypothetical protein
MVGGVAGGLGFDGWLSCCADFPRRFSKPESTALDIRALDLLSAETFGHASASTGGEFDGAPGHFSNELLGSLPTATAVHATMIDKLKRTSACRSKRELSGIYERSGIGRLAPQRGTV